MPIHKEEFIKLSLERRTDVLWQGGELIAEKVYYDCNICLFLLDSFYVEIFYDRQINELIGISVQESSEILYAYIKDIDIETLLADK